MSLEVFHSDQFHFNLLTFTQTLTEELTKLRSQVISYLRFSRLQVYLIMAVHCLQHPALWFFYCVLYVVTLGINKLCIMYLDVLICCCSSSQSVVIC